MKNISAVLLGGTLALRASSQQSADWPVVNGPGAMHYSALKQIHRGNVKNLQRVWQFDSNDQFEGSEMECNPIVIDDVLYATTPRLRVIALDAATGKLLWDFDAHRGQRVREKQRNRGLTYWSGGEDRRLFVGIDQYLYAVNARTGQPVESFGDHGRIDLHIGLGAMAQGLSVQATSPAVVYKDLLILGSLVAEDLPAAPGYIRAFDVRTGQIRWTFHTIPLPGEYGYDTWPKDAYTRIGGAVDTARSVPIWCQRDALPTALVRSFLQRQHNVSRKNGKLFWAQAVMGVERRLFSAQSAFREKRTA